MESLSVLFVFIFSEVPMFAQVLEPWQNYFVGVCEGRGYRSEFDMIHLKKIPPHCKYLSGELRSENPISQSAVRLAV